MRTRFSRFGRWMMPVALLTLGGVMAGCGGGGGGGEQRATLSNTRTATIQVVQQSRALPRLLGLVEGDLANLTTRSRRARGSATYAKVLSRLWSGTTREQPQQAQDIGYIDALELYARVVEGTTTYDVLLFEDAGGAQPAGSIRASITSLTSGRVTFNVTGGALPATGTLNLSQSGDTVRTTGTLRLTELGQSITPDLTSQSDGTTTGSMSVGSSNGTIRYSNLTAATTGRVVADVTYRTAEGDVAQDEDGGGRVRLGLNSTQRYEALYNTDGSGTLTLYNDGAALEQEVGIVEDFDEL